MAGTSVTSSGRVLDIRVYPRARRDVNRPSGRDAALRLDTWRLGLYHAVAETCLADARRREGLALVAAARRRRGSDATVRFSINSLRARLIVLVLVAVVPSLGGAFVAGLDDRNSATARAETEVARSAGQIAAQLDRVADSAHATLLGFAAEATVRYHVAAGCSSFAKSIREIYPVFANLAASDSSGDVFCSGVPLMEPISASDRLYFREALRTRSFVGSGYQISMSTSKPTINYAYPVIHENGDVLAVVFAALDLEYLNDEVARYDLPAGATLDVVELGGRILVHYPESAPRQVASIQTETIAAVVGDRQGGVTTTTALDGREQIVGFRRLASFGGSEPTYVLVGLPSASARNEAYVRLIGTLISIGLSALFALAFALIGGQSFLVQPIHLLLGSLTRLKAGDYTVRAEAETSTTEIRALGAAFDEVAAALETREAEIARTTAALREREEQYRLVFDAAADAMLLVDIETGAILDANGSTTWLYGYSREELLRMRDEQLSAEPEKTVQARVNDVRRIPLRYQRRKDGSIFAVEASASVIRVGGRLARLSSIRDITAKLESERVLRESEARHRLLFTQMISGFMLNEVVCDALGEPIDLRILEMNAEFERLSGISREASIGRSVFEVAPATEKRWIERLGWVALSGDSLRFTDSLAAIGKEFEVNAYSPRPGQVAATFQDVTERLRAERALEQRTRDLLTLHEIANVLAGEQNVGASIIEVLGLARRAVAADVCCLYSTPDMAIAFDRPLDDLGPTDGVDDVASFVLLAHAFGGAPGGGPPPDFVPRGLAATDASGLDPAVRAKLPSGSGLGASLIDPIAWLDVPVRGREGRIGTVRAGRVRGEPFGDAERSFLVAVGHHLGLVVENSRLAVEATQVEVFRQMDRLRSEFVANVSHELRTPLGLIVFLTSTLRREGDRLTPQVHAELIDSLAEESARLTQLVENLVDISRLQSGQMALQRRWQDLRDLIQKSAHDLRSRLADYRLNVDLPDEAVEANVDGTLVDIVLRNLLVNAMQYSEPNTRISIGTFDLGGVPGVTVRDEGIGIPPQETKRVFERFYRVESEAGRRVGGVGLGLAICRGIVRAHGGDIWVESTPGRGSTFFFTLPSPGGSERAVAQESSGRDGVAT